MPVFHGKRAVGLFPVFLARRAAKNADKTGMSRKIDQSQSADDYCVFARIGMTSALLIVLCGVFGCGLKWNMFVTPQYRIPPGYSETYRRSLEPPGVPVETDPRAPVGANHGPYFTKDAPPSPAKSKGMSKPDMKHEMGKRGADRSVDLTPKSPAAKSK